MSGPLSHVMWIQGSVCNSRDSRAAWTRQTERETSKCSETCTCRRCHEAVTKAWAVSHCIPCESIYFSGQKEKGDARLFLSDTSAPPAWITARRPLSQISNSGFLKWQEQDSFFIEILFLNATLAQCLHKIIEKVQNYEPHAWIASKSTLNSPTFQSDFPKKGKQPKRNNIEFWNQSAVPLTWQEDWHIVGADQVWQERAALAVAGLAWVGNIKWD